MQPLNEKPCLGFESKNPAPPPGHNLPNFTAAIGDSWRVASETRWGHEMGRFMSPDPSGLYYADPTNPQSLNLYSYVRNNPLKNTDPTGLDCVYLNDEGAKVQSVDHDSNFGECVGTDENGTPNGSNGGYWVNGNVNAQNVQVSADSGQITYGAAAVSYFQNGALNVSDFGNTVTANANVNRQDLNLSSDARNLKVPMDQIGPTPPHYPDLVGPQPTLLRSTTACSVVLLPQML
jgi:hypothetical protein